ncbi:MAG: hypothetical protein KF744_00815 [Taibaiella sp.]|nr:hypothetical protein [Taibaiella sp.]
MKGRFTYLFTALFAISLFSCDHSVPKTGTSEVLSAPVPVADNGRLIDTAISLLQTGDVVLRMGAGAQSMLLSRLNKTDKGFSHCGLVVVEHGYPYVYHCIGGEDNPDARMRRDSAHHFFSPLHNTALGIARLDVDTGAEKMLIINYFNKQPRFDLHFDMATDDELYCTEFAWKVLTATAGDTAFLPLSEINGRRYVGTDNLYLNNHAHLIWRVQFM